MKQKKYWALLFTSALLLFLACEKPTEYRQYLGYGQQVFPGKANNIAAYGGLEKLKVVWGPQADPSVVKYVIYWDNGATKDSLEHAATAAGTGGLDSAIINNLSETDLYTITIYAYDAAGNRSVPMTVQNAVVYGSVYRSNLTNRPIISATMSIQSTGDSAIVKWGDPGVTLNTKLTYTDKSGVSQAVFVSPQQTETVLRNVAPQTKLSYQSSAIPIANSPDTISTFKPDTATIYIDPSGGYTSNGYVYHPSAPRAVVDVEKDISKIAENQFKVDLGDLGGSGYAAMLTFDPVTGNFSISTAPGAAGSPYTPFPDGLPTSNPGYTAQWAGSAECNNTFDPVTKTFKLRYGYMGGNGWRVTEEFIKYGSLYTMMDKSKISALKLPGDAGEGCHGSSYARLFDGKTGEFWHSCSEPNDQYPFVMSFDLGSAQPVGRFKLDERSGCCQVRSPGAFQIWGTNDIATGAGTINVDNGLAAWEADATAKGWVKLANISGNTATSPDVTFTNTTGYRYIRFVAIEPIAESENDVLTANFDELTFWKKN